MTLKWGRDLKAESGMKRLNIEWTVETVRLADIDIELSMERQARIGKKINDDWVLDYAQSMSDGAEFPMCILQRLKGGRFFIWSGNHRTGSARFLNELEYPAYIAKITDQRMMDILPRIVNTWEGHRESREAVLEHAKYVVERHGLEAEKVAKMFGLNVNHLWVVMRAGAIEERLEQVGVKKGIFSKTTVLKLGTITNNNALKATAKLLKDENLAGTRAEQVIDDVKRGSTETQMLAEVSKWRKVYDDRKPKNGAARLPIERKNRSRFIDGLSRLERFLDGIKTATQLQLDEADVKIVAASWDKIERRINALMKEGK